MKTFRVRYLIGTIPAAWDTRCVSPITALNHFHRHVQKELLKLPEEYTLTGLFEVYNLDASGLQRGSFIESEFDLPKTTNPDLSQIMKESLLDEQPLLFKLP
jgi:hypothetical protein